MIAASALAGDVEVKVTIMAAPNGKPATNFNTDAPEIVAMFDTTGIGSGDKVKGVLVAEDVGDAAPANTEVLSKTLTLDEDTSDGVFTFIKPTKGWPAGKYRVEIYVNDELATKTKFTIGGGETTEKETNKSTESSGDVPSKDKVTAMTQASILSFGDAVTKQDFSEFYNEAADIWQKQTSPEKLRDAFKDFYGKDIDLRAALKGKEPVFNQSPTINSDGVLLVQGYYPTTPNRVVFQLKYFNEEGEWKLVGINVNLKE